jgi:phage terminase large subunit-like protein
MKKRSKKIPPNGSSPDPVEQYALDVVSGKEIAGPLVRLACQRHLDDLRNGEERGIWWDWPAAERVIHFFRDVLRLSGGESEGKPFILAPSQVFIVGSIFGWKGADGYRRFRVAYIEEGKGNGKSPLAAGIGLYMLVADKEPRAEIYAAAVDKDQARILFRDAVAMVDQSVALDSRLTRSGGRGQEWNLAHLDSGSFFRPISSESTGRGKSGPRPHCAILDEVHEHPTDAMVEFMRAGTKGRTQALILMITNAGVLDAGSVCMHYHDYASRVLNGESNDAFFCYVCGLDKQDDWKNPAIWKKANPLLGVSIPEKYLQEQVRDAIGMPSKQSLVRRLNFCEWVESADPWIEPEVWRRNGGALRELRGRLCWGGLDLASKNDLSVLVLMFEADDDGIKDVLCRFWTPGDTLHQRAERDRAPYEQWVREGHLIAKPGATIDYRWIAKEIGALSGLYGIHGIAFDRWRIEEMQAALDAEGVNVDLLEHGQGFESMNPSIEAAEDDLKEGRLRHGNHPVLTHCVYNVRVVKDQAGNRKFDKRKATGRIDGAQALAMAAGLYRAKAETADEGISIFSI